MKTVTATDLDKLRSGAYGLELRRQQKWIAYLLAQDEPVSRHVICERLGFPPDGLDQRILKLRAQLPAGMGVENTFAHGWRLVWIGDER